MTSPKYIADGFLHDATQLLNEFTERESMEFSVFAEIWRKRRFSLIYMGRENAKELGEFTQEIFCLSTKFLLSDTFLYKVGATFLLYALYHNQISKPPIRIRILISHFQSMKCLLVKAIDEKLHSLHYVLDNLIHDCTDFVAFPTLMGPNGRKTGHITKPESDSISSSLKSNLMELKQSNILEELEENFARYARLRSVQQWKDSSNQCTELVGIFDRLVRDGSDENSSKSPSNARSLAAKNRPKRTYLESLQKSQILSRKLAAKQANDKSAKAKPDRVKRFQVSYEESDEHSSMFFHSKSVDSSKVRTKTRRIRSYFKKSVPKVAYVLQQDTTTSGNSSDDELLPPCAIGISRECDNIDLPLTENNADDENDEEEV